MIVGRDGQSLDGFAHPHHNTIVLPNQYVATNPARQLELSQQETVWARDRQRLMDSAQFLRLRGISQMFFGPGYTNRMDHVVQAAEFVSDVCTALDSQVRISESLGTVAALAHDIGHPIFNHDGETALTIAMRNFGWTDATVCHNKRVNEIVRGIDDIAIGPYRVRLPALDLSAEVLDIASAHSHHTRPGRSLEHNLVKQADRIVHTSDDFAWAVHLGLMPKQLKHLLNEITNNPMAWQIGRRKPEVLSSMLRSAFVAPTAQVIESHNVVGLPIESSQLLFGLRHANRDYILETEPRCKWRSEVIKMICDLVNAAAQDPMLNRAAKTHAVAPQYLAVQTVAALDETTALGLAQHFKIAAPHFDLQVATPMLRAG